MKNVNILIIDDNKSILSALDMLLRFKANSVEGYTSPDEAFRNFKKKSFDVVLLDMNFKAGVNSGNEGLYWLEKYLRADPTISIILFTAYGDVDLAVKAIKKGAVDFILKPWDNEKLLATLMSAIKLTRSNREINKLKNKQQALIGQINKTNQQIVGQSNAIKDVFKLIEKVAFTDANILIVGENGTGKELVARQIHCLSKRKSNVLVTVDMGAVPESLFESELFGHKKGAFTDAYEDRIGKFEMASNGSLFLDEIGNLPLTLQAKLLSVLQNRTVVPIGSNQPINVDVRIISATNGNIDEMIKSGQFREDLLYRLNTITIEVPPLRERVGDVALLANFFLVKYASKYNKGNLTISDKAIRKLESYNWPGNVRELQHTIEKAVILAESKHIGSINFSLKKGVNSKEMNAKVTIVEMEQRMIEDAISRNLGNISLAADELGVTRQTLYNKMKKYGL